MTKYLLFACAAIIIATLVHPTPIYADALGETTLYDVPTYNAGPRSITTGVNGNLWFVEYSSNKIGEINTDGEQKEHSLPSGHEYPHSIINGPEKSVWFTTVKNDNYLVVQMDMSGNIVQTLKMPDPPDSSAGINNIATMDGSIWITRAYSQYIQKISVTSGDIKNVKLPTPSGVDPNNYYVENMANYDDYGNNLWVGTRERTGGNSTVSHYMVKLSPDGTSNHYRLPYDGNNFHAIGDIVVDNNGDVWFLAGDDIGNMSRDGSNFSLYEVPADNHRPVRITKGVDGKLWTTLRNMNDDNGAIGRVDTSNGNVTEYHLEGRYSSRPYGIAAGVDGNNWFTVYSSDKVGKIGTGETTPPDADNDGLNAFQELQQGTSDHKQDTDLDGLSDYSESKWNTNKNNVFCDNDHLNCAYPDPLHKDIYIEIDWMVKPGSDGYSMQPTSSQITTLETSFHDKNITAHFDTGKYGGGNKVSYNRDIYFEPNIGSVDFYDYKRGGDGINSNFDTDNRYKIWHYMLAGYHYLEHPDSSGVSYAGDDDSFISYGHLKEGGFSYDSFDTAVSGTIIHELGHTICLTNSDSQKYEGQPEECRYDGIDNEQFESEPYKDYKSSMNYTYQLNMVDYSNGVNGTPEDHDDWSAIRLQDFTVGRDTIVEELEHVTEGQLENNQELVRAVNVEESHSAYELFLELKNN